MLTTTRPRSRKIAIPIAAIAVAVAIPAVLTTDHASAYPTWSPSSHQLTLAEATIQAEAWTTSSAAVTTGSMPPVAAAVQRGDLTATPANPALPSSWPSDTLHVAYVATTRSTAEAWIDNSTAPDDRDVVVARLTGDFVITVSGPPGSAPTQDGTVLTITVDPTTGQVMDIALSPTLSGAESMPAGATLFDR